jgi:hypothetical protein
MQVPAAASMLSVDSADDAGDVDAVGLDAATSLMIGAPMADP